MSTARFYHCPTPVNEAAAQCDRDKSEFLLIQCLMPLEDENDTSKQLIQYFAVHFA